LDVALEVLLIDDEPDLRAAIADALAEAGHHVTQAGTGGTALQALATQPIDVVICDVRLPDIDGLTLLRRVRETEPAPEFILMTAYADVSDAVSALKVGAYDYLTKPFAVEELVLRLERIDAHRAVRHELERAREALSGADAAMTIIGRSAPIQRVLDLVETVGRSDVPTLVTGESGTGKELVARMLHERSVRRGKPFVVVNCGALTETLIEAELFGHERGAFTGAVRKREGRFMAANGGTIFLDEIAELPLSAQAKLLRVLQEGTFEPLGTNTTAKVDVRIVSATHRDLKKRAAENLFREDLFYRINVIQIDLPPLRDRPGDLPLLFHYFLRKFAPTPGVIPTVTPAAWTALSSYAFPGNVREFSHAVEHACILSGGRPIDLPHLPPAISRAGRDRGAEVAVSTAPLRPLQLAVKEFEREYLARAVRAAGGRRGRAAEMLGISRKSLWEKLRAHGIASDETDEEPLAASS
jgi:two-component system, NtrC family, response regulator HydG